MTIQKKPLVWGIVLSIAFWTVLVIMFMPWFDGENAFHASDKLFNSISKGSTHYIPALQKEADEYNGKEVELELLFEDDSIGVEAEKILTQIGMNAKRVDTKVTFKGDLGKMFEAALKDSDDMFNNNGEEVKNRYGIEERRTLFVWWSILKAAAKDFNNKGGKDNFSKAKFTSEVTARGVEVAYNYYRIEPENVSSKAWILTGALIFYVIYTLWWGFAIFFLAEGAGLKLEGGTKKET